MLKEDALSVREVNILGDISGLTGYGCHTREVVLALERVGFQVTLERFRNYGDADWNMLYASIGYEKTNKLKEICNRTPKLRTQTVAITLPNILPLKLGDRPKRLLAYCIFEGGNIPLGWAKCLNDNGVDKVLVPSSFTAGCLSRLDDKSKIVLAPHGVDCSVYNPNGQVMNHPLKDFKGFTFLFVGGWKDGVRDRKGLDLALRAFTEEFGKDENVCFFAKINQNYGGVENVMANINSLGLKPADERARIYVATNNLSESEMAMLYRMNGTLVNSSKGEAYGFNCFEALACGMPIISSPTGFVPDFVNKYRDKGVIVVEKFKSVPATGEDYIYEDATWMEIDIQELREKMRYAFENYKILKEQALEGSKIVANELSWDCTAKAISVLLE